MNETEPDDGDRFVEFDAPYVLGALSETDRAAFEDHLVGCAACRARVADLRTMPALLSAVPAEAVESLSETGPTELPQRATLRPPRHRWVAVGAGLAVAASMATALAIVATRDDDTTTPTAPPVAGELVDFSPVADIGLTATVRLTAVDWGTKIDLECSLPGGASYSPGAYTLIVRDKDGRDQQVAGWLALQDRSLRVPGSTAVEADDIAALEIREPNGTAVLVAEL